MEYLAVIGGVTLVHILALMSPGPDFLMIVRNSLVYSRRTGLFTAVGLGLGIAVHISYSILGLALVISKSILLFNAIKLLGAAYLIYIGTRALMSKKSDVKIEEKEHKKDIPRLAAIKIGFLTNVLNPKATLFFLSLFTFVISPDLPGWVFGVLSVMMVGLTMIWFSLVSIFLTQKHIRSAFHRFEIAFNKVTGALLIALGIKVALSDK